jgi:hypothetical protein
MLTNDTYNGEQERYNLIEMTLEAVAELLVHRTFFQIFGTAFYLEVIICVARWVSGSDPSFVLIISIFLEINASLRLQLKFQRT